VWEGNRGKGYIWESAILLLMTKDEKKELFERTLERVIERESETLIALAT
jgi:hypothetical protein